MSEVLFNAHDVVLIATMLLCIIHISNFISLRNKPRKFYFFSSMFFLSSAAIPLDTLINFGSGFHPWIINHAPNLIYVFEFGAWLQAPFGYLLFVSLLDKNFRFTPMYLLLFVPFVLHTLHQFILYHSLDTEIKVSKQLVTTLEPGSPSVFFVQLAREAFCLTLVIICFRTLRNYRKHTQLVDRGWPDLLCFHLFIVCAIGASIACMLLIQSQSSVIMPIGNFGLGQNYFAFLSFTLLTLAFTHDTIKHNNYAAVVLDKHYEHAHVINPEYVAIIEDLMQREKVYTDPALSVERMAKMMNVSPRTLSSVINGHYHCNFGEFINRFRLNEAKRLLLEKQQSTILDIMYASGFNSKATFNGVFKRVEGQTPTEFRRRAAA